MLSRMKSPLAARIVSVGAAVVALAACSAPQPAPVLAFLNEKPKPAESH